MKYRYLKITNELVWGTDNLTKEDLVRLVQRSYDCIIDTQENKTFNKDTNSWDDIKGD